MSNISHFLSFLIRFLITSILRSFSSHHIYFLKAREILYRAFVEGMPVEQLAEIDISSASRLIGKSFFVE